MTLVLNLSVPGIITVIFTKIFFHLFASKKSFCFENQRETPPTPIENEIDNIKFKFQTCFGNNIRNEGSFEKMLEIKEIISEDY